MRMRLLLLLACGLLLVPSPLGRASARAGSQERSDRATSVRGDVLRAAAETSVRFEPAGAGLAGYARYVARGPGYAAFVGDGEILLAVAGRPAGATESPGALPAEPITGSVTLRLRGASPSPEIVEGDPLPGVSNYLVGDRSSWRTGVRGFASLRCRDVYPGIDLVLRGTGGSLEYDFDVAPGADPSRILIELAGDALPTADGAGGFSVATPAGTIRHSAPLAFEEGVEGSSRVACALTEVGEGLYAFDVGARDPGRRLVIDPVLAFSTYLGGGANDSGFGVAFDYQGNLFVCGYTISADFPRVSAVQNVYGGTIDAFVTKYFKNPSSVDYCTYLGGSAPDVAFAIAVDRRGNAYVAGSTTSPNFPTATPIQVDPNDNQADAFVARLSDDGTDILYSTYLGGSGADYVNDIAVDTTGAAYVVGTTDSTNLPVSNAAQPVYGGGANDGFCAKIAAGGSSIAYLTYLGGSQVDYGTGVAIDADGSAYVIGGTDSANFPVANAFQSTIGGAADVYVTKLSPDGHSRVYSTFLGGTLNEFAGRIAVDQSGSAVATGYTVSTNYPTLSPIMIDQNDLKTDAFVTRLAPSGSALVFSTYLGGNGDELMSDVALDVDGNVYVVGSTTSTNFPTVNFLQVDGDGAVYDAYVTEINAAGTALLFSTYVGGGLDDSGVSIAVNGSGAILVGGQTLSTNFPTQSPRMTDPGDAAYDAWVLVFGAPAADVGFVSGTFTPNPAVAGSEVTLTLTVRNNGPDPAGEVYVRHAAIISHVVSVHVSQGDYEIIPATPLIDFVDSYIGRLEPGATATVEATYLVPADATGTVAAEAFVVSSAADAAFPNNYGGASAPIVTITPPDATGVQQVANPGQPYKIKLTGTNFQQGVVVYIGMDAQPWADLKYKSVTSLVLKGSGLKQKFPKGVAVPLRVVNPDGGEDTITFTR